MDTRLWTILGCFLIHIVSSTQVIGTIHSLGNFMPYIVSYLRLVGTEPVTYNSMSIAYYLCYFSSTLAFHLAAFASTRYTPKT
jgi:hypothetical protein